jgi:hypothetical protein
MVTPVPRLALPDLQTNDQSAPKRSTAPGTSCQLHVIEMQPRHTGYPKRLALNIRAGFLELKAIVLLREKAVFRFTTHLRLRNRETFLAAE